MLVDSLINFVIGFSVIVAMTTLLMFIIRSLCIIAYIDFMQTKSECFSFVLTSVMASCATMCIILVCSVIMVDDFSKIRYKK